MTTFTDSEGRKWTLKVNVDAIKCVRRLTDIDLLTVIGGDLLERLADDPILLCDVIYALCRPEAETKNISDEDFGQAMAGDAIEQATAALLEALADFFPSRRGKLLRRASAKLGELQAKVLDHAEKQIASGALDEQIKRMLAPPEPPEPPKADASGVSGGLSMNVPASSDSIPGP